MSDEIKKENSAAEETVIITADAAAAGQATAPVTPPEQAAAPPATSAAPEPPTAEQPAAQPAEQAATATAAAAVPPVPMKMELTRKGKAIIIGSVAAVIAAIIIAVILLWPKTSDLDDPDTPGSGMVITPANVTEIQAELREKVERGMFATYMNVTWRFPNGNAPSSNAVMGNSSANRFPFWFTITLSDDDDTSDSKVVYTSGLLPVGTQLDELILDVPLPAGTYPAIVHINMIDDDGIPVESNTGINVTLIVEA